MAGTHGVRYPASMEWKVVHPSLRIGIKTEGPLAALGHDRVFDQPADITVRTVADGFDGAQVVAGGDLRKTELLGEASEKDREEILKRKDRDVLSTDVFPVFSFEAVYREAEKVLAGTLSLHGASRPVRLPVTVLPRDGGAHVEGEVELDLRPFGVKPYKALMGALRVNPVVTVSYALELKVEG